MCLKNNAVSNDQWKKGETGNSLLACLLPLRRPVPLVLLDRLLGRRRLAPRLGKHLLGLFKKKLMINFLDGEHGEREQTPTTGSQSFRLSNASWLDNGLTILGMIARMSKSMRTRDSFSPFILRLILDRQQPSNVATTWEGGTSLMRVKDSPVEASEVLYL